MSINYLPFHRYADAESDEDYYIACPVCGDSSDYCLDVNHHFCEECGEMLVIDQNMTPAVWKCERCEDHT